MEVLTEEDTSIYGGSSVIRMFNCAIKVLWSSLEAVTAEEENHFKELNVEEHSRCWN